MTEAFSLLLSEEPLIIIRGALVDEWLSGGPLIVRWAPDSQKGHWRYLLNIHKRPLDIRRAQAVR